MLTYTQLEEENIEFFVEKQDWEYSYADYYWGIDYEIVDSPPENAHIVRYSV